jgi:deazaflavin-dependent oxidoreductase (nitroreductase family)
MSVKREARTPWLPPRWVIRLAWSVHRGLYRIGGRRIGLWPPRDNGWGALRLTTTGRRTGQERSVILGYFEDGPNLVSLAMNGWGEGEPAWWLNLRAQPDATVDLVGGRRMVRAHAATGDERARLWARWSEIDKNLDAYAARRFAETAVVVLTPRNGTPDASQAATG